MIHLEFGLVGSELGPVDEFIQVEQQQRLSQKPLSSGSASAVWRSHKVNPRLSPQTTALHVNAPHQRQEFDSRGPCVKAGEVGPVRERTHLQLAEPLAHVCHTHTLVASEDT